MMASRLPDTDPEIENLQIELGRVMPDWRKFRLSSELTERARDLVRAGLREKFPHAGEVELRRRFATVWLGTDLATEVYGPEAAPPTFDVLPGDFLQKIKTHVDTVVLKKKLIEIARELVRR